MGIITKPNTFTGQSAPQLPWLDADIDTIYSEFNGNIDNANIKSDANISQSKILNLVADLAAKLALAGGTMTGDLVISKVLPRWYLQYPGVVTWSMRSNASADMDIIQDATILYTLRNGGTPANATDLTPKSYVDALVATIGPLAFGTTTKTDGDFTTSSTAFEDVAGLSVSINSGAHRHRISFVGKCNAGTAAQRVATINCQVGGVDVLGAGGIVAVTSEGTSRYQNASFSIVTPSALAAGAKTFQIQIKTDTGSSILRANTTDHAVLQVEELPA